MYELSALVTVLAIIGLPACGAWALWLWYFISGVFPWQAQIELLKLENTELRTKVDGLTSQLDQVRERLIDNLIAKKKQE